MALLRSPMYLWLGDRFQKLLGTPNSCSDAPGDFSSRKSIIDHAAYDKEERIDPSHSELDPAIFLYKATAVAKV